MQWVEALLIPLTGQLLIMIAREIRNHYQHREKQAGSRETNELLREILEHLEEHNLKG